jgi:hypothetical protein
MSHNPQKYIFQELLVRALLPCRVSRLEKRRGVASALGRRTVLIRSCGPATTSATWEDMKGACEELFPMLSRGIGARDGRNATRDRRQREVLGSVMGSVMRVECGGTSRNLDPRNEQNQTTYQTSAVRNSWSSLSDER